jgi:hypothetical protein
MGQYYMPVIKRGNKLRRVCSHNFDNGLKLTEHSYVGNDFVNVVANDLVENPAQLYWVGDYAEANDFISESMFNKVYDYAWNRKKNIGTSLEGCNTNFDWDKDWYYINLTKKEYMKMPKEGNWIYSPISLLTAIGNGRGGGDYCGGNRMVGCWAGDKVYLSTIKPEGKFTDITGDCDFGNETFWCN